jgi:hypothetical protein
MRRITTAALALLLAASMALPVTAAPKKARTGKSAVFDFEAETLSTDFLKPNTMVVEGMRRAQSSSLISVRLNFVREILRSAEDI